MEQLPEPSRTGSVVLNIGGDVGAAVVVAPASLSGAEIEIRRLDTSWDGTHVAVRARQVPDGDVYAAVFESLTHGGYEVRVRRSGPNGPVAAFDIEGGRVTTTELRV